MQASVQRNKHRWFAERLLAAIKNWQGAIFISFVLLLILDTLALHSLWFVVVGYFLYSGQISNLGVEFHYVQNERYFVLAGAWAYT